MEDNKFFSILKIHGGKFLTGSLVIAGALFYFARLEGQKDVRNQQDFLQVKGLMDRFYANEPLSKEAIDSLGTIFSRHPELASQYEGSVALSLLPLDKSIPYLQKQIERAHQFSLNYYEEFLQNALLINTNKGEALNKSQELETKLTQAPECEKLRLLNLLRIIFLAEELEKNSTVQSTLATLEKLPSYPEYAALFQVRSLTLQDHFSKKS